VAFERTVADNSDAGERRAPKGGKFVIVRSSVKNIGLESLYLTDNYPIEFTIFENKDRRRFETIQDLPNIAGNPPAGSQWQPGFSIDVTWVVLVPEDLDEERLTAEFRLPRPIHPESLPGALGLWQRAAPA
jgi:hypothetical protein